MKLATLATSAVIFSAAGASAQPLHWEWSPGARSVVSVAEKYVGTNPTGWSHDWCAVFLNGVLRRAGKKTLSSAQARAFYNYPGQKLSHPVVGAIAVKAHHVGIVKAVEGRRVLLVSGNTGARKRGGRRVGYTWYAASSYRYVMPS